jgi:hypothetical protein
MSSSQSAALEKIKDAEVSELPSSPEDIGAARLRELAERLSGVSSAPARGGHDSFYDADEVVEPVSLSAILALGRTPANDTDAVPAASEISEAVQAVSTSPAVVPALLAPANQDEMPIPLRFAGTSSDGVDPATSATSKPAELASSDDDREPLIRRLGHAPPLEALVVPGEHGEADVRLVDLIRRQQTLLDRLHKFPQAGEEPVPEAAATEVSQIAALPAPEPEPEPAPAEQSVVERLAPPPFEFPFAGRPQTLPEAVAESEKLPALPPPLPPAELGESTVANLSERAPIIIQRAHAERSGMYDPNEANAAPSVFPAFAAGIGLALALAGTLFFLL